MLLSALLLSANANQITWTEVSDTPASPVAVAGVTVAGDTSRLTVSVAPGAAGGEIRTTATRTLAIGLTSCREGDEIPFPVQFWIDMGAEVEDPTLVTSSKPNLWAETHGSWTQFLPFVDPTVTFGPEVEFWDPEPAKPLVLDDGFVSFLPGVWLQDGQTTRSTAALYASGFDKAHTKARLNKRYTQELLLVCGAPPVELDLEVSFVLPRDPSGHDPVDYWVSARVLPWVPEWPFFEAAPRVAEEEEKLDRGE